MVATAFRALSPEDRERLLVAYGAADAQPLVDVAAPPAASLSASWWSTLTTSAPSASSPGGDAMQAVARPVPPDSDDLGRRSPKRTSSRRPSPGEGDGHSHDEAKPFSKESTC